DHSVPPQVHYVDGAAQTHRDLTVPGPPRGRTPESRRLALAGSRVTLDGHPDSRQDLWLAVSRGVPQRPSRYPARGRSSDVKASTGPSSTTSEPFACATARAWANW